MEEKIIKNLLGKLRQPIHIDYISKYILKLSEEDTKKQFLDKFINLASDPIIEDLFNQINKSDTRR
jgi:hypothetical protein